MFTVILIPPLYGGNSNKCILIQNIEKANTFQLGFLKKITKNSPYHLQIDINVLKYKRKKYKGKILWLK